MNLAATSSPTISAPVLRARLAARGLVEASHSSSLNSRTSEEDRHGASAERRRDTTKLFHFGTAAGGPNWDGPRLSPTFAAQVIGQILMEGSERGSAGAASAYRSAQIAPGAFFDRGV